MATDLIMRKRLGSLAPADPASEEALRDVPAGKDLRVTIKVARNPKFHRLFWGLLKLVADNTDEYAGNPGKLLLMLKIGIGHVDTHVVKEGAAVKTIYTPKSISFSNMNEVEFREFFNRAVDFLVTKIIPGTDKAALIGEVYELLGLPYQGAA